MNVMKAESQESEQVLEVWMKLVRRGSGPGRLPENFDRWDMEVSSPFLSRTNNTVAHAAAVFGVLPKNFDQWDLRVRGGWTVAHEAAYWGTLPDNFGDWHLEDRYGKTVAEVALQSRRSPQSAIKAARAWLQGTKGAIDV
jgi:hypothetical protein